MPVQKNFTVHHNPGRPPWVTPDGGNGHFLGPDLVQLSWKADGSTGPFTLRFRESPGGPVVGWPFSTPEPSWPVGDCQATKDPDGKSYKYDVIIAGHESDPLDPMLVFDRSQRRGVIVIAVAVVAAVIGFLVGLAF